MSERQHSIAPECIRSTQGTRVPILMRSIARKSSINRMAECGTGRALLGGYRWNNRGHRNRAQNRPASTAKIGRVSVLLGSRRLGTNADGRHGARTVQLPGGRIVYPAPSARWRAGAAASSRWGASVCCHSCVGCASCAGCAGCTGQFTSKCPFAWPGTVGELEDCNICFRILHANPAVMVGPRGFRSCQHFGLITRRRWL